MFGTGDHDDGDDDDADDDDDRRSFQLTGQSAITLEWMELKVFGGKDAPNQLSTSLLQLTGPLFCAFPQPPPSLVSNPKHCSFLNDL